MSYDGASSTLQLAMLLVLKKFDKEMFKSVTKLSRQVSHFENAALVEIEA